MELLDLESPVFAGQNAGIVEKPTFYGDHPEIAIQSDQDGFFFFRPYAQGAADGRGNPLASRKSLDDKIDLALDTPE
jgi:hypothetical protein